jgi:hypothetical protein
MHGAKEKILPPLIGLFTLSLSEGLNAPNGPKGCASDSIATGRTSHAGEVEWQKRHKQPDRPSILLRLTKWPLCTAGNRQIWRKATENQ